MVLTADSADPLWKDLLLVELCYVRLRQPLLLLVSVENRRPVRCSNVRPLPVQLGRIVRHREENPQ